MEIWACPRAGNMKERVKCRIGIGNADTARETPKSYRSSIRCQMYKNQFFALLVSFGTLGLMQIVRLV